jgi:hypothetical protein
MNGSQTVMEAIIRFGEALGPLQMLFNVALYVMAFIFALVGTLEMRKVAAGAPQSGQGQLSWGVVGTTYLLAIMCAAFPTAMSTAEISVFGQASPLRYQDVTGAGLADSARQAVGVLISYMQFLGWIFFIRGWVLLRKAAQGRIDGSGSAWTHIVGGLLLADIVHTVNVISTTLTGQDFFSTM